MAGELEKRTDRPFNIDMDRNSKNVKVLDICIGN